MTELRWLGATGLDIEPLELNEHGYGTGHAIEAKAVALAGPWLLVERGDGTFEILPEHRVAWIRLDKTATRFRDV
ncbi:MAG TPA: hypothetical protein VFA06_03145 [Actinocrinis sp.]|uniref:hypothetical protein n=1 Tax=Actinocrinis sp. TaxID=1920516 RepID=UPI002D63ED90|nr:hypothetical protein [Actinocrinis sp.]HZU54845.1 hypothetical protein [Actinocrinis sp.]